MILSALYALCKSIGSFIFILVFSMLEVWMIMMSVEAISNHCHTYSIQWSLLISFLAEHWINLVYFLFYLWNCIIFFIFDIFTSSLRWILNITTNFLYFHDNSLSFIQLARNNLFSEKCLKIWWMASSSPPTWL